MADEPKPSGRLGTIKGLIRWQRLTSGKGLGWLELGCGLIVALIGVFLIRSNISANWFVRVDYDYLVYRNYNEVPDDVVIVYLDDESHHELDQPFTEAWDRGLHALLVDQLTDAGARLVVFDILFFGESGEPDADLEFAEAIARNGRVILAGQNVSLSDGGGRVLTPPHEMLRTNALSWGLAHFLFDGSSGVVREHLASQGNHRTLGWEAARQLGVQLPAEELGNDEKLRIKYYGPPLSIRWVPFHRAIDLEDPDTFKDKIVFIGAKQSAGFSGGGKDTFPTPYTYWSKNNAFTAGVEIHATMLLNLMRGDYIRRWPDWVETLLAAVVGFGFCVLLLSLRPRWAFLLSLVVASAVAAINWYLFRGPQLWYPWFISIVQVALACVIALMVYAVRYYFRSVMLEHSLAFHVSPKRAKQLLERPELLKPHGDHSPVSFFFSDIEGFTTVSDRIDPNALFASLNKYFDVAMPCFYETDGTVMQFVGDAIYAIWNAPEPQEDHTSRAVRTALRFRDQLAELRAKNEPYAYKTRIGLHSGYANVGNSGSDDHFEYAAIGKDTNMAARLEGLNKYLGTEIIGSEALVKETGDEFLTRPLGRYQPKGSDRIVAVHEIIGTRNGNKEPDWLPPFRDALAAFRKRDWDKAESLFETVLEMRNQLDGPSRFYLNHTRKLRDNPPGQVWMGEVVMDDK